MDPPGSTQSLARSETSSYPPHPLNYVRSQPPQVGMGDPYSPSEDPSMARKRAYSVYYRGQKKPVCTSCRTKKVRCDGAEPACGACMKSGYPCFYERAHKRLSTDSQTSSTAPRPVPDSPLVRDTPPEPRQVLSSNDPEQYRHRHEIVRAPPSRVEEAKLKLQWRAKRIASDAATPTTSEGHGHPFDFGLAELPRRATRLSPYAHLTDYWTYFDLQQKYKEHVHDVLPFVNYKELSDMTGFRFDKRPIFDEEMIDIFICQITVIASAFTRGNRKTHDRDLMDAAKERMDASLEDNGPTYDLVAAWNMRTIALLMTKGLKAAWISSCTAIHVAEQARTETSRLSSSGMAEKTHLFWVTKFLNVTIAVECDKDPVPFVVEDAPHDTEDPVSSTPGLREMYQIVESSIDQPGKIDLDGLRDILKNLEQLDTGQSCPALMWKALFIFRLFRQIRPKVFDGAAKYESTALRAGSSAVEALQKGTLVPWWHTPRFLHEFLYVCLFVGTNEAYENITKILDIFRRLGSEFPSANMAALVQNAERLVRLTAESRSSQASILQRATDGGKGEQGRTSNNANGVHASNAARGASEGSGPRTINWTIRPNALVPHVTL